MKDHLYVEHVFKAYHQQTVLHDVSAEVNNGEFYFLLGPSGCGKTTLMRIIAGLTEPDQGQIFLKGQPLQGVPAYRRDVNTVFQNYALFPHMTVFANVAYPLRVQHWDRRKIEERVTETLTRLPV